MKKSIGSNKTPTFNRLLFGVRNQEIGEKSKKPVILNRLSVIDQDQFAFGSTLEIRETFSIGSEALE